MFKPSIINVDVLIRFFYYTLSALDTHSRVESMRRNGDVFVDRTMVSTIAYHKAMGIPDYWFKLIPQHTIAQIDQLLYFTASEETRRSRIEEREKLERRSSTKADQNSFIIGKAVDIEYRKIIPERTLIIQTDNKNPNEIVDFLKGRFYA